MNRSVIGKTAKSPPYLVEPERITSFAASVGEVNPIYYSRGAAAREGYDDQVAPLTFPIVLIISFIEEVEEDPQIGWGFDLKLYAGQEFKYERPIVAGDRLTCTHRISEIATRGNREFATIQTAITDESNNVVCQSISTIVCLEAQS